MGQYRYTSRAEFVELMGKFDLTWSEIRRFNKVYHEHRGNATGRGHLFEFTLSDWVEKWIASGHWKDRGLGASKYCMARIGDCGAYCKENVKIVTNLENRLEQKIIRLKGDPNHPRSRHNPASKEIRMRLSVKWAGEKNPMSKESLSARGKEPLSGKDHPMSKTNPLAATRLAKISGDNHYLRKAKRLRERQDFYAQFEPMD